MDALEIVAPLQSASAPELRRLAQTASSLEALSLAGIDVTLVLIGEKSVRDRAWAWLSDITLRFGIRQIDFEWIDSWSVLEVSSHIATPYFAVLEPGRRFIWPDDVPLRGGGLGALCFATPAADDDIQVPFWVGGSLAPFKLGKMRATVLWHGELCERARIMLDRMDEGRKVSRARLDPWRAYLAVNEERLIGVYRLVQGLSPSAGSRLPPACPIA